MAIYMAIHGQLFLFWPCIGHRLAINVFVRAAHIFVFIDASAQDGGPADRRAGALASMKNIVFASLDPKMTPWGVQIPKMTRRGVNFFSFDLSPVSSHRHAVVAKRKSLMS